MKRTDTGHFIDLDIDATAAADLNERVSIRATVTLPRPADVPQAPIVCFALPGATYSRKYFMLELPGAERGGQAAWHARRGWIFVAIDHLGVGESSLPEPSKLIFKNVAATNHAVVEEVLRRLASGSLAADFPAITKPVVLGMGQSMGGCLTVIQQARHASYDAIAILGFSAVHTHPPQPPGNPRVSLPYVPRDTYPGGAEQVSLRTPSAAVNSLLLALGSDAARYPHRTTTLPDWHYHFDDELPEIVRQDMEWGDVRPHGAVRRSLG